MCGGRVQLLPKLLLFKHLFKSRLTFDESREWDPEGREREREPLMYCLHECVMSSSTFSCHLVVNCANSLTSYIVLISVPLLLLSSPFYSSYDSKEARTSEAHGVSAGTPHSLRE